MMHWHNIRCIVRDGPQPPKIQLVFYRTEAGNEPVRDWLKELVQSDRLEIGMDLQRVQYRWPVVMPLCRALGEGLWAVRTRLPSKTIARASAFTRACWWRCTASSRRRRRHPTRN